MEWPGRSWWREPLKGQGQLFAQPTTTAPDYTGLQIQTAVNTLPIPIVWGMSKLAPNVIWYNDFQTYGSGGKGGKGGGGGGGGGKYGGSSQTTYSASVILAPCEGPIVGINTIWKNESLYTLAGLGLSLFTGTDPQSPWSYVSSAYPSQALAYEGTAYVCAENYSLGDSATLDNHNFEIMGLRYGTGYGQIPYTSETGSYEYGLVAGKTHATAHFTVASTTQPQPRQSRYSHVVLPSTRLSAWSSRCDLAHQEPVGHPSGSDSSRTR